MNIVYRMTMSVRGFAPFGFVRIKYLPSLIASNKKKKKKKTKKKQKKTKKNKKKKTVFK